MSKHIHFSIFLANLQDKQYTFCIKAGLLMYTKEFEQFVWEEELQVLELRHFYLGKHSFAF